MKDSMLGKVFALSSSDEQAAFLNAVGRVLRSSCEGSMYYDMQLSRISDDLDRDGKEFVNRLAAFTEDAK